MQERQTNDFYEFGGFRLDVKKRRLLKGEEIVALTSREFDVLLFLVENAGRVVEKKILLDAVWSDVFVEETTLARNVSWLRQKLAAESGEKFIETVPKRGYCFTADVEIADDAADLIVEEKAVQRIRVEETLTLPDAIFDAERTRQSETSEISAAKRKIAALPVESAMPASRFRALTLIWTALGVFVVSVGAFIVYQNYFQHAAARVILANRLTPFSGAAGRENTPAFSPDGKQLAFSWDSGEGDSDVYVRLLDTIEPLRLTNTEFNEQYPVFSPDGSHIAFVRDLKTYGEIILISVLGGAERRIARLFSGNFSISFAPDGKSIAVVDTEDSTDGSGKQYRIYSINLETGERRRLTAEAEFAGETTPRFSPDGKNLAFVRVFDDRSQDLFIVPTTGNAEPRQITFDRKTIHSLAWSAEGNEIFFVSLRDGKPNVWRVSATGNDEEPEMIVTNTRGATNIAVSPDAKTIALVENADTTSIRQTDANNSPPRKFAASNHSDHPSDFSPDGSRIIFTSNRTGINVVWMADADGKNLRQITAPTTDAAAPEFSPDGLQIVYQGNTNFFNDIFIISNEGGAPRRLTSNAGQDVFPTWSADGKWIYFTSDRTGEMNIWKIPAAAGSEVEAVQVTHGGNALKAFVAPDGKTVFYTKRTLPEELWQVSAEGGEEKPLPEFVTADFTGNWTMARTGIYFFARQPDQTLRIKFYDFADKKIKDAHGIMIDKISSKLRPNIIVNADGSRFLYEIFDQNVSNIMLAEIEK